MNLQPNADTTEFIAQLIQANPQQRCKLLALQYKMPVGFIYTPPT